MPWLSEENCIEIYENNGKQINLEQYVSTNTINVLTERLAYIYDELDDLGVFPTGNESTDILCMVCLDMLPESPGSMRDEG